MRKYIIPYAVLDKNGWATAVNVFNNSRYTTAFDIKIYKQYKGLYAKTISKKVAPYGSLSILPDELNKLVMDPNGAAVLEFFCSNDLIIQCGMWNTYVGYDIIPEKLVPDEKLSDLVRGNVLDSNMIVQYSRDLEASNYLIYGGNTTDSYMLDSHFEIIDAIAKRLFHSFPDRLDRYLRVGDCSPIVGSAGGHPEGHNDKMTADFDYYVLSESNTTQYRPGKPGDWCWPITDIWKTPGIEINPKIFDWERNYWLMRYLYTVFKSPNIRVSDAIYSYMSSKIQLKYGQEAYIEFGQNVQRDPGTKFNHHTHMHVAMGSVFNKEAHI
jgi:hypothetical protein